MVTVAADIGPRKRSVGSPIADAQALEPDRIGSVHWKFGMRHDGVMRPYRSA
jgi:hypothetical protein